MTASVAFDDYDALIATMVDWLNRNGSTKVANRSADFVRLFESGANKSLRVREMLQRATASLSSGYLRLPTDWIEAKNVQINLTNGAPRKLDPVSMAVADDLRARAVDRGDTDPKAYCINGNYLEVVPYTAAALAIEMTYYGRIPTLSSDNPVNDVLTAYPELYLYGSLVHSAPYLRDDERVGTWGQAFSEGMTTANEAAKRAEMSGGVLRTRARLRN